MNCETLKKQLAAISYNDVVDAVELRYILLKILLYCVTEYKSTLRLQLLHMHRQLEKIQSQLKVETRNGSINQQHFIHAKHAALSCLDNITMKPQALPVAA